MKFNIKKIIATSCMAAFLAVSFVPYAAKASLSFQCKKIK